MKTKKIFNLFLFLWLFSCNITDNQQDKNIVKISENVQFKEKEDIFWLKSGNFNYQIKKNQLPFKKIVVLNTSLLGYLVELEQEDKIIGVAGTQYIYSEKVRENLAKGKTHSVGSYNKYDLEKIISLKPDAVFSNYISTYENFYNILKNNGIQVIFFDEYLEQNPLEKTKYLLAFGKLLGVENKAQQQYSDIENDYHQLKNLAQKSENHPKVLVNELYGNHWFMPGGKTYVAHYLNDAKADYILKNNEETKAIPMSFEEVFARSQNAEYWLNVGDYQTKKDLLAINPAYKNLPVFQNGKIYNIAKRKKGDANDHFERGSVRSDWILRDYIKILHPELLPQDTLTFMKELK